MPDLDLSRLGKILGMLGSNHDGEKLAALARAEAMLKAAGKTWADVVGIAGRPKPIDKSLEATLNAERVKLAQEKLTFQAEKMRWQAQQREWRDLVAKEQRERLERQHQEDLARNKGESVHEGSFASPEFGNVRYRRANTNPMDDPMGEAMRRHNRATAHSGPMQDTYDDWPGAYTKDTPDAPPQNVGWFNFRRHNRAQAEWIEENMDTKEFAASLYEWVCRTGRLTPKQAAAVQRNIDGEFDER